MLVFVYSFFVFRYESTTEHFVKEKKTLTQKDLVSFSYQVARGMEYLASRRVSKTIKRFISLFTCKNIQEPISLCRSKTISKIIVGRGQF